MPPRQSKSARRERLKLVSVVLLGLALGAILLWPGDDSVEPATPATEATPIASSAPRSPDSRGPSRATDAALRPTIKLPRLDSEAIAAFDPFAGMPRLVDPLASDENSPAIDPEDPWDGALATIPPKATVRAVYRTARGAVAIVNDQIIPVKDAKQWITTLQSTDSGL